jgi:putative phosphoesterase
MQIGVISDTQGLLRPEAVRALQGVDRIVHAGDVGSPDILERLRSIAPTVAVRGNVDTAPWADALPTTEVVEVSGLHLYLLHDIGALDLDPEAAGFDAVIYGHSHKPGADLRNGVLFLNPGSAGPRRFSLPVSMARLEIRGAQLRHELIDLAV